MINKSRSSLFITAILGAILIPAETSLAEENIPVSAPALITRGEHACAIEDTGVAKCWGTKDEYQTDFPNDMGKLIQISQGDGVSCAINDLGVIRCWEHPGNVPFSAPADLGKVIQVAAGSSSACVIKISGNVFCWKRGENPFSVEVVPENLGKVSQIVAGSNHYCALEESGFVQCWGWNVNGQTEVPDDLGQAKFIAASFWSTCAITLSGKLNCWGRLGFSPSKVVTNVSSVSIGPGQAGNVCAIVGGNGRCWGGDIKGHYLVPFFEETRMTQISVGGSFVCAVLETDSKVKCFRIGSKAQSILPTAIGLGKVLPFSQRTSSVPVISSPANSKRTIVASFGQWGKGVNLQYQWLRGGVPIPAENGALWPDDDNSIFKVPGTVSHSISVRDVGRAITLEAIGQKAGFAPVRLVSNSIFVEKLLVDATPCGTGANKTLSATLDASKSLPAITGSNKPGHILKGTPGVWSSGTKTCAFWMIGEKTSVSLKAATYKILKSDVGKEIRYVVMGTKNNVSKVRISKPLTVPMAGK